MASYIERTLSSGERVVHQGRVSLWSMPVAILVSATFVMSGLSLALGGEPKGWDILAFGAVVAAFIYLTIATTEVGITDRRIVLKRGILSRKTVEIPLHRVESVSVDQGIFDRILGYGTVTVIGTGSTREPFSGIVDPLEFRRVAMDIQHKMAARS